MALLVAFHFLERNKKKYLVSNFKGNLKLRKTFKFE